MSGSGISNVGNRNLYENGNQRTVPQSDIEQKKRRNKFHEGKKKSHKAMTQATTSPWLLTHLHVNMYAPEDELSIANRLAREEGRENEQDNKADKFGAAKKDPTAPAKMHGNEPSKGAKIDAEFRQEKEELIPKGKLN